MLAAALVEEIARRTGTPCYVYDSAEIRKRFRALATAFPGVDLRYFIKANPHPRIVEQLAKAGAGAAVTSPKELAVALAANVPASRTTVYGPGKDRNDLGSYLAQGVREFDIDSPRQLVELDQACAARGDRVTATLRINPRQSIDGGDESMAGGASVFGMDEERVVELLGDLDVRFVRVNGIHVHAASGVLDPEELLAHYERTAAMALRIARAAGFPLEVIDLGGGIGIAYCAGDREIDLATLGRRAVASLRAKLEDSSPTPTLRLDPGRFLVANAGVFVTRVVDVKHSRGERFVVTDGGISAFARPAMPWARPHDCSLIPERRGERQVYRVVGRSCMPSDVLSPRALLPEPVPGDLILFHQAGAYGLTMSLVWWSGSDPPLEFVHDGA
jgi:diaminopimelate decarboxylase